jgi:hypothetical protein
VNFGVISAELALQSTTSLYAGLGECDFNGRASVVSGAGLSGE